MKKFIKKLSRRLNRWLFETAMTKDKISSMTTIGRHHANIKQQIVEFAQTHRNIADIDHKVKELILATGATPSFFTVPGYKWSTCINVNDSIVHGIPHGGKLKDGDLVTIDTGLYFNGYHTDSAVSFIVGEGSSETKHFLKVGYDVLKKTIAHAKPGKTIRHLSQIMQEGIESQGYNVVRQLTGHGVGEELHMDPPIPCYVSTGPEMGVKLQEGMTIAIEVMYTQGDWLLITDSDGWTMRTKDGKLSAVVEETVLITKSKPIALTAL